MKISVILAHSDKASFNHAIASIIVGQLEKNKHDVFFDLYAENFNPLLSCEEIPKEAIYCRSQSKAIAMKSDKQRG